MDFFPQAVDAGDTIFVHTFGAYFGLAISRVLYDKRVDLSKNEGSSETHDMFSMIGAIFLWMFWPSFNSAAVVVPDAQHRAVLNTFFRYVMIEFMFFEEFLKSAVCLQTYCMFL